jgi:hypothetical protein
MYPAVVLPLLSGSLSSFVGAVFAICLVGASFEQVRAYFFAKLTNLGDGLIGRIKATPPTAMLAPDQRRLVQILTEITPLSSALKERLRLVHRGTSICFSITAIYCLWLLFSDWTEWMGHWCGMTLLPVIQVIVLDSWAYVRFRLAVKDHVGQVDYLLKTYHEPHGAQVDLNKALDDLQKCVSEK